ncbi:MAG: hypothetical protein PHQ36_13450, partial [Anaerolineales bacterium]|nr:hypothetical protein [Anaerolineales bacterium]
GICIPFLCEFRERFAAFFAILRRGILCSHDKIAPMNRFLAFLSFLIVLIPACATTPVNSAPQDQSAPSGSVLFQDDFSSQASGFNRFKADEGIMDYDTGGYRIFVSALNTNFWATPRKNFADVRMEADAGKLGGPDANRIGLICRYANNNYYFFLITSDGFYGMGVFFNGQAILLGQKELQSNENIKKGLAVNHLRADCAGATLAFYVNGAQVATAQNDVLKSGDVGLLAGTFEQPGADIIFDNFVVLKP